MNVSCPDCRSIFRVDPAKVPPAGVRARCSVCSGVISIPAPTGQSTPASSSTWTPAGSSASSSEARPRTTPSTQPGWDTAPFSAPAARTPAAPAPQRPPAQPAARTIETPAAQRPRPESVERSTAAATATPPSPASGVPDFKPAPLAPPFRPSGSPAATSPAASASPAPSSSPFVPGAPRATAPTAASPAPARPVSTPPPAATPPAPAPSGVGDAGARRPLNPFLSKDPNQRAKRLARALVSDIITYHPAKHAEGLRDGTLKQLFREEIKKSFEEYIAQVGQQLAEGTTYFQEALNEVLGAGKKIF
jgi:predicted Zn finger-like uncharacterized protein